jgi:class 3 adenylate cyclase/tetratricopeptide (TPR) repeat protein
VISCPNCGAENAASQKFCGECGTPLASVCSACGATNQPGQKFCGECGNPLAAEPEPARLPAQSGTDQASPASERRLVSVLFADLVGFTSLSETRDAEEVRELLSQYFELSRTLIARYGGTVEKFIGDAVMAVWGTPTATEDDAERAVRAALDLVASVPELDPGLQARAGVLTGEAAVTIGAEGQGMVAGDLVNTTSRIQSAAEPGAVLVGESTRRATEQAVAYEEAGPYTLKGKSEPVALSRALRIVSGVGGQLRSAGLEPPFVGRDRELKLIKDLFQASAHDGRAHLVSVTGIGGIGKSRLAWEFYKYFDGIVDTVWWHRGRCLAYGEGVAYWALADMVRMRCLIGEDEPVDSARAKLSATLHEHLLDPAERSFVEPRLAHLLGLEDQVAGDRQELFAAWRLFFERLADTDPVVLAFEDMHWADTSLLDFVEYLLEWSRDLPLYVITLARPELHERRPGWGAGQRNFTSLYLEPLSAEAMEALLEGLVPGLPPRLRDQILARAEGVPLYAVETVRMLLDRGLLEQDGPVYRPTGEIETLEVPETLHALIAARLDGLDAEERRLLQDASVLGKTFTARALSALTGLAEDELGVVLQALVRKEVVGVQSDPRSPERGQYGFLQDLVRHVAYETLSKRERKLRHLAAAHHLQSAFPELDEIAEVLASHYLAAAEAAPEADDAEAIRVSARDMLARAGRRAGSLGAPEEGQRYFEQAAALADDPLVEAELLEQAGRLGYAAGRLLEGREQLERAIALFEQAGETAHAGRASAGLADIDVLEGRLEQAAVRLESALVALEEAGPSAELAWVLAQLGRMQALRGDYEHALTTLERALTLAEKLGLDEIFVQALTSKAIGLLYEGRFGEGGVLLEGALDRARAEALHTAWLRAAGNLGVLLQDSDQHAELLELTEEIEALARQLGDREQLAVARLGVITPLFMLGRWAEVLARAAESEQLRASDFARVELLEQVAIHSERGQPAEAESVLATFEWARDAEQPELRAFVAAVEARLLRARGRHAEALAAAERGLVLRRELAITNTRVKRCLVEALEAAFSLGDLRKAEELMASLETLQPGELTPFLRAHRARFRARLDAARGNDDRVDGNFRSAAAVFREFGFAFYLAVALLEHAEWLAARAQTAQAEPLLAEARETFERLEAGPWLDRADQLVRGEREPEAVTRAS